jgi:O-antigen/teichoic acid export membrane protein
LKTKIFHTLVNNGINSIFPIIIIPIATQKLTADAFGYVAFILTIYSTALAVTQVGFDTYGLRELGKEKGNHQETALIYSELVLGHIVVITSVIAIMAALKLMGFLDVQAWVLSLVALTLFTSALQTDWALFANGKFGDIALRNLVIKSLAVSAVLLLLREGDTGTTYVAILLSSYIVSSLWTFALVNRFLSMTVVSTSGLLQRIYAIRPFMISRVMSAVLQNADLLVVGWVCKPEETAFYFIARKVTQAGSQFFSHIAIVFNNALYTSSVNNDAESPSPLKGIELSIFFSLFAAVFISANGAVIIETLSGQGYLIEPGLLQVLSIVIVTNAFTNHIGLNVLYFFGKDYAVAKSMSLSAAFLTVTIVLFTRKFGIYGAAAAVVSSNLLMSGLHSVFSLGLVPRFLTELATLLARPILIVVSLIVVFVATSRLGISYTTLNMQMVVANLSIAGLGFHAFHFKRRS